MKEKITEDFLLKINTHPKAKYELIVNGYRAYSFVTTSRSTDECIEELKSRLSMYAGYIKKPFHITKKNGEGKSVVYKGHIDPIR